MLIGLVSVLLYDIKNVMAIQRTLAFYPFFILGFYCGRARMVDKIRNTKNRYVSMAILLVGSIMSVTISPYFTGLADLFGLNVCAGRVCNWATALMIGYGIITLLPSKVNALSKLGHDVLFYYAFHPFLLMAIGALIHQWHVPESGLILLLVEVLVLVLLTLMSRIRMLRKIICL